MDVIPFLKVSFSAFPPTVLDVTVQVKIFLTDYIIGVFSVISSMGALVGIQIS
jgi:hypothetical protein